MRTSRPSGQAVGKMDKSNRGPYRVMEVVGWVLFKLQDVQTGAILASLKHGDALTHCPSEDDSDLRVLQECHGDPPDAQGQGQGGDGGEDVGRPTQRPDPRTEMEAAGVPVTQAYSVSITQGTEDVQEIRMLPHLQKTRKQSNKQKSWIPRSDTVSANQPIQSPLLSAPVPSASVHTMKLWTRPQ